MLNEVKVIAEASGNSYGSRRMRKALNALGYPVGRRKPAPGLVVHSDRGSQYASKAHQNLLKAYGLVGSMSRKGDCWDNAAAESFFASQKMERVQWKSYQTRSEAQQDILDYMAMFYNSRRLHSSPGYVAPKDFGSAVAKLRKVA